MTTSTPRHRKRPISNPNLSHHKQNHNHSPQSATSSTSTITSLLSEIEPPPNLLPSKSDFLQLAIVVAIAAAVAALCSFLSAALNRPPVPFCDSSLDFSFSDSCEPCPSYGRCYNGELECVQGYRKYGKFCIEDGVIYETAKRLSEWTKDCLCKGSADFMCYGTGAIWVSENNLKNILDEYGVAQGFTVTDAKYSFVVERAMEDINEFVETRTTGYGIKEFKCPDILADYYKPMSCRLKQWIANHFLVLIAVFALLAGCMLLLMRVRRSWNLKKRAEHLYHQVCDILEDNALMFKGRNDGGPWLVASRLRDHLLSTKERKDPLLWKMVEELVESDSRIDRYPKLVKGEMKVVWEWQVEGSLSSSRRKKLEASKQRSVEIALDYNELQQMS